MSGSAIRVCFVTTGLNAGGAEQMLLKLMSSLDPAAVTPSVVSLTDEGVIGPRIRELGVPVTAIGLGGGRNVPSAIAALAKAVGKSRPNVVQGWMYHGNVAAWGARVLQLARWKLLWSIRQSLYDLRNEKKGTALTIRLGARMSRHGPRRIIYNSTVAARQDEAIGYDPERTFIIPNGFDTNDFRPDHSRRTAMRMKLGIPEDVLVLGLFARYHPMKNHENFLQAVRKLLDRRRRAHCVLAGEGTEPSSLGLRSILDRYSLMPHATLLGVRTDVADLTRILDIACLSSSWGEGFPNVIGEAMATAVPCVVTDVGDSAYLVGSTGLVVPPNDSTQLADAIGKLDDMGEIGRATLGASARHRILASFSLPAIARQYEEQFEHAVSNSLA